MSLHVHDLVIGAGWMVVGAGSAPRTDVVVTVDDGLVSGIHLAAPGSFPARERIEAPDAVLVPGFVDAHARPVVGDGRDQPPAAALLALVARARAGITCFAQTTAAVAVPSLLEALQTVPLRARVGVALRGAADLAKLTDLAIVESDRVSTALSPYGTGAAAVDLWREVREIAAAQNLPVHAVLAPGQVPSVEFLAEVGGLGPHLSLARAVRTRPAERELLARYAVPVVHCPTADARSGAGRIDLRALVAAGITVGLGTGAASGADPFEEMKFAAATHKQATGDPRFLTTRQVIDLATRAAAVAVHRPRLGRVEVGAPADLVLVSQAGAHVQPVYDVESSLVHANRPADVTHTVVGGRIVVADRRVVGVDEAEVLERLRRTLS